MAHFLVTGGCGFIGSHLVGRLLSLGHRVRVLDDLSSGRTHNLAPQAELVLGDVASPGTVDSAMRGVTGCFHLAAITNRHAPAEDWLGVHRVNQTGTIAVLDAARQRAVPVVYASSAAVYGDCSDPHQAERSAARPITAEGADKLACEWQGRVAALRHGVPNTGLRLFSVYGPRQEISSPYAGVVTVFSQRLAYGKAMTLHGDGQQVRDFIFVTDTVAHFTAAMDQMLERQRDGHSAAAQVFNVCTGRATRIRDLALTMAKLSGRQAMLQQAPARPGDVRLSLGDPSAAIRDLHVAATTSLEDGLCMTLSRSDYAPPPLRAMPMQPAAVDAPLAH